AGRFLHRTHHGTIPAEPWVSGLAARARVVTETVTTRDRDHAKPKLAIEGEASEGDGELGVYAWPARAKTSGDAARRAKTSLEALRARRMVVTGTSDSLALRCGKIFAIESE